MPKGQMARGLIVLEITKVIYIQLRNNRIKIKGNIGL
jgi:hypothetical protein